jgi:hypothetical protein
MMDYNDWLIRARELRTSMYEHEAEFYLFLIESEQKPLFPWKGTWNTFEDVLKSENLADPAKYTRFRDALTKLPAERAHVLGCEAFCEAARVVDADKRELVLEELTLRTAARHVPLSRREAARVVQDIAPVERPARHVEKALKSAQLEAENKALRKQVARLEAENKALETENAELRSKLASFGGGNKKVRSKPKHGHDGPSASV